MSRLSVSFLIVCLGVSFFFGGHTPSVTGQTGGMFCNSNHGCTGTDPDPTFVDGQRNPYNPYVRICTFDPTIVATVLTCDPTGSGCTPTTQSITNACEVTCSPYSGPTVSYSKWFYRCV